MIESDLKLIKTKVFDGIEFDDTVERVSTLLERIFQISALLPFYLVEYVPH